MKNAMRPSTCGCIVCLVVPAAGHDCACRHALLLHNPQRAALLEQAQLIAQCPDSPLLVCMPLCYEGICVNVYVYLHLLTLQ
jgi:hypothetical protein